MTDLPELSEAVRRKLTLKWIDLLERRGFKGAHLQWHQEAKARRSHMKIRAGNPVSVRAEELFSPDYPDYVDSVGIAATCALTEERFGQIAGEYLTC